MRVALPFDPDWDPNDPERTCYTCGTKPALARFHDGSPTYSCPPHPPVMAPEGWLPPAPPDIDDLIADA